MHTTSHFRVQRRSDVHAPYEVHKGLTVPFSSHSKCYRISIVFEISGPFSSSDQTLSQLQLSRDSMHLTSLLVVVVVAAAAVSVADDSKSRYSTCWADRG